jgi:hypothetical protein
VQFYDAPLHVKALNGMVLIDDFGRQKFSPTDLLNRLVVPMESRVDYFKLTTGASFSLPFDVLLMFSTNLEPSELMEPAFLRRIQYKIKPRPISPDLRGGRHVARPGADRRGVRLRRRAPARGEIRFGLLSAAVHLRAGSRGVQMLQHAAQADEGAGRGRTGEPLFRH